MRPTISTPYRRRHPRLRPRSPKFPVNFPSVTGLSVSIPFFELNPVAGYSLLSGVGTSAATLWGSKEERAGRSDCAWSSCGSHVGNYGLARSVVPATGPRSGGRCSTPEALCSETSAMPPDAVLVVMPSCLAGGRCSVKDRRPAAPAPEGRP